MSWLGYATPTIIEQAKVVGFLSAMLWLFQTVLLHSEVHKPDQVLFGLVTVVIGLFIFIEGVKIGVMPLAAELGTHLPRQLPLAGVLAVVFVLGCGATLAEPAMGALRNLGSLISYRRSPLLKVLLSTYSAQLNVAVALGVGLAAVVGTLMLLRGWSLRRVLGCSLLPAVLLSAATLCDPQLQQVVGLAWDTGAVTTGPVTVPIVLALGRGLAQSRADAAAASGPGFRLPASASATASGFGIVALAGIYPVSCVLLLASYVQHFPPSPAAHHAKDEPLAMMRHNSHNSTHNASLFAPHPYVPWWVHDEVLVMDDVLDALRAGLPLVFFLLLLQVAVLRRPLPQVPLPWKLSSHHASGSGGAGRSTVSAGWGLIVLLLGLCTFEIGLKFGLVALGYQCGVGVPAAFSYVKTAPASPLYPRALGLVLVGCYALLLGGGGTLAEPAMLVFADTVDGPSAVERSPLRRNLLIATTAAGVAVGLLLSLLKLLLHLPFLALLLPLAAVAGALSTQTASDAAVGIAWDSAGVTTGEVTTPLILALGLGVAKATMAPEGFGLLALASLGPVITVLLAVCLKRARPSTPLEGAPELSVAMLEKP